MSERPRTTLLLPTLNEIEAVQVIIPQIDPAWIDEGEPPVALAISTAAGIHELPEAIGHSYDGSELMLYAVFTDQPLSVRDVEERMSSHGLGEPVIGILVEDQQRITLGVTR